MTNPLEIGSGSSATLHVLQGALQGKTIPLRAPEMKLGREGGDLDLSQYVQMSRLHSRIFVENGVWNVQDLGSTNGTHVNGERVVSRRLQDGDVLQLGNFTARISLPDQRQNTARPGMTQLAPPVVPTTPPTQRLPEQPPIAAPVNPWPSQPAPPVPPQAYPPPIQQAPPAAYPPPPHYQVNHYTQITPPKNSGLAAVLSFLWCGLGQFYNGEIGKGFTYMLSSFIAGLLTCLVIGWFILPVVWILGIIDAYQSAERINAQAQAQAQNNPYHPPRY
jgi:pSer/pThr/pTyr-binding forkhead associated (FHA) protein